MVTTVQDNLSIEAYYTKIKTIGQDLNDYRPINDCTCGGLKSFIQHLDSEYIMIFFMGLNESYSSLRAQILLMDPLPSISKVFFFVVQEEHRCATGNSITHSELLALLVTGNFTKCF